MAKKDFGDNAASQIPTIISGQPSILYVTGVFLIGWCIYRSGYNAGVSISNKVLKRHDKDVKQLKKEAEKREKQLRKELSPETENKWKWWPW